MPDPLGAGQPAGACWPARLSRRSGISPRCVALSGVAAFGVGSGRLRARHRRSRAQRLRSRCCRLCPDSRASFLPTLWPGEPATTMCGGLGSPPAVCWGIAGEFLDRHNVWVAQPHTVPLSIPASLILKLARWPRRRFASYSSAINVPEPASRGQDPRAASRRTGQRSAVARPYCRTGSGRTRHAPPSTKERDRVMKRDEAEALGAQ